MKCKKVQSYLLDRVLGEPLPGMVEEELREHLSRCSGCRRSHEEIREAWQSLRNLEDVRFPRELSRNVLRQLESEERPAPFQFLGYSFTHRRLSVIAVAAAVAVAAGLFLIFQSRGDRTGGVRLASTYSSRAPALPDVTTTLENYLEETRNILCGIREGTYNTWGSVLFEINSRDLQGRANFLLESSALPTRARPVIGGLHDAFWRILQAGRGREDEEVRLPPDMELEALLDEIDEYKIFTE